jgi:hypothetical protein
MEPFDARKKDISRYTLLGLTFKLRIEDKKSQKITDMLECGNNHSDLHFDHVAPHS